MKEGSLFVWEAMSREVLLGSVFTDYTNDLDEGIQCNLFRLLNGTKLSGNVSCEENTEGANGVGGGGGRGGRLSEWTDLESPNLIEK